jgi:diguanylate cyclase (GGDEF)-like protein/PAS domain S-box-containing protein
MRILDYLWAGAGFVVVAVFFGFAFWQLRARRRIGRGVPDRTDRRRSRFKPNDWAPALFLLAVALVIAAGGYRIIRVYERNARESAHRQLSAIADLSVLQIEHWLAERKADADAIAANPYVASAMRRILAAPEGSRAADSEFHRWLGSLKENYRYEDIFLIDAGGAVRASANPKARPPSSQTLENVLRAMRTKSTAAVGFRVGTRGDQPIARFGMVAPLAAGLAASEPATAALLFRIDPDRFLIPTIERWPIASRTGETLLMTVERGEFAYLTRRRHGTLHGASRFPASMELRVGAMVARGAEGILEGLDYRDVPVLGAGRKVRGTPWFVVAKIDVDEVYAPIRREVTFLVVVTVVFILGAAALTGAWWRGQLIRFAAAQREGRLREQALVRHFEYLSRFANDMVLLTDETGVIVEANDRAVAAYGYAHEELIGLPMSRLRGEGSVPRFRADDDAVDGVVYEAEHRRKDGTVLPVEVSVRSLDVQGRAFAQAIIRDVSARKRAEERLQFQAHMLDMIGEAVVAIDPDGRVTYWNRGAELLYSVASADALGASIFAIAGGYLVNARDLDLIRGGSETHSREIELRNEQRGEFVVLLTVSPILDPGGAIAGYIGISRDITERKQAERRLAQLAQYDTLTGLPNRNLFRDRLDHAIARARRAGRSIAVMFLDLDQFKEINDTLGHAAGDALLRAVGDRLRENLREVDTIARLGGDEFTVIVESISGRDLAEGLACKIVELFASPIAVGEHEMSVTCSVGVTLYPDDADDAEGLLKTADIAMYRAKHGGRNAYRFYSPQW